MQQVPGKVLSNETAERLIAAGLITRLPKTPQANLSDPREIVDETGARIQDKMHGMTWGEFKKLVEAAGVTNGDKIWYFDFSFPTVNAKGEADTNVFTDDELGIVVQ